MAKIGTEAPRPQSNSSQKKGGYKGNANMRSYQKDERVRPNYVKNGSIRQMAETIAATFPDSLLSQVNLAKQLVFQMIENVSKHDTQICKSCLIFKQPRNMDAIKHKPDNCPLFKDFDKSSKPKNANVLWVQGRLMDECKLTPKAQKKPHKKRKRDEPED